MELKSYLLGKKAGGGGIDTSDATATSGDIKRNKTAYSKGEKLTGTFDGIIPSGSIPISTNGNVDVTNYATANVNVSSSPTYTVSSSSNSIPGYQRVMTQIEEITIDNSNWQYLFKDYKGASIPRLKLGQNISKITSLASLLSYATYVKQVDLSNLDTSSVTSMASMFSNTNYLSVIDISSFDFSKVSASSSMFSSCGSMASVSNGAYADGVPYVYVKDATAQAWVIDKQGGTWTTNNVVIKS